MDELFEELVGYLMQKEEANIQENTNHEDHNSIPGGIADDNMMPVAMMDSFNINVDYERDGDCYNPHMDLQCNVDDYDYQLGALLYDECLADLPLLNAKITGNFQEGCVSGNPSDDRIQCDRLLPDVTDTSLENCDIDPYFNLMETSTMQQKTDGDVCCDPHQPQSPSPSIPDHEPQQVEDIGDDVDTSSKNLKSERYRRKRLNQQYLTLRSIVPNITKMDKRTVLVDALAYLQDILHQTQIEIENQNKVISSLNSSLGNEETINLPLHHHNEDVVSAVEENAVDVSGNDGQVQPLFHTLLVEPVVPPGPPPFERRAIFPAIMQMEVEKLDEERYVLRIVFNEASGTMGLVQRSVEMLKGFESINVALSAYGQHHVQSSNFLRVKKIKGSLLQTNEEDLLNRAKESVKQLGHLFLPFVSSTDNL
ncbi:hypothetical protein C5167_031371 [Papaver somniferum]|uniref:BHLH domain-containing protein n=1 Tax=Papaver somniferum TaxID=3469 RepID=A0A4Y7K7C1_PAPSO|nr:uncharacterized protein LOC113300524 [Papaver somniferum]RZC68111.1 hypothetical protein C5167_031371 [Papaver somniferum]